MEGSEPSTEILKEIVQEKNEYHLPTKGDAFSYIVAGVILPVSYAYTKYKKAASSIASLTKKEEKMSVQQLHDDKVARVCQEVREWQQLPPEQKGTKGIRTDRNGNASHSVRENVKTGAFKVQMGDFDTILELKKGQNDDMSVVVEPGVTVGKITNYLTEQKLQLAATLEMEEATLGGLVMATGMTTHSHVCGLTHDTVLAYDIVTADGEAIHVTAENEHSDLFRSLPWSHGTLGILVAVELQVVPAAPFVHLEYIPFYSHTEYTQAYQEVLNSDEPPFFLEMIIFSKNSSVLMKGTLVSEEELSNFKDLKVNKLGNPSAPWFFKHVETVIENGKTSEMIPIYDYLMRHGT